MRIKLIQLCTPNIDTYAQYSLASVNNYCEMHGYQHVIQRDQLHDDLHINWTKIEFLKQELQDSNYDVTVLVDADTIITNPEVSVQKFIKDYGDQDTHILMPEDTPFSFKRDKKPNAGFIIVKHTEIGKRIISDWMHAATHEGKHLNDIHPRNQRVYWKYVMPKYLSYQRILPRKFFSKPLFIFGISLRNTTKFLFHITQSQKNKREQLMKSLLTDDSSIEKMTKLLSQKSGCIRI